MNRLRLFAPAVVVGLSAFVVACGPGPTPTTTTTTTTTSSTTTTTIDPNCTDYTPGGVVLSDPSASAGDTITVSGTYNGPDGETIELSMVPTGPGTATGVITTTTTAAGAWSTALTIPNTVTPGTWDVVANVEGCTATASASITIV